MGIFLFCVVFPPYERELRDSGTSFYAYINFLMASRAVIEENPVADAILAALYYGVSIKYFSPTVSDVMNASFLVCLLLMSWGLFSPIPS